jgi:hypothetical protein
MTVTKDDIRKNHFKALFDLQELFRPQKDEFGNGYIRISAKGDFGLFDYGVGLLSVQVSVVGYGKGALGKPDEEVDKVNYTVLFTVGCADDGLWQAWSRVMPKEKCEQLVEKIKTEILDDLSSLPKDTELNEMLQPYGLFGQYE